MGQCCSQEQAATGNIGSKPVLKETNTHQQPNHSIAKVPGDANVTESDSFSHERSVNSTGTLSINSTPSYIARKPSPSRPIQAGAHGKIKVTHAKRLEHAKPLDKNFGYLRDFPAKYELGIEVGRGHFGFTCCATVKSGEHEGQIVAVKVILKSEMATEREIEDVRREVTILKVLSGHANVVQFYEVYEDQDGVYIVMELCKGGELLDHILSRGGKYAEDEAKEIAIQMLRAVSSIHLQGVVHRDLKPENFLFTKQDESYGMKVIDFGLSDFVIPDGKLNDIVGSAYYVAPEVLEESYGMEADIWSIGVIAYILLSGNRPFWAQTESAIFLAVTQAEPNYDEIPWPSISWEAKDFVKKLLTKDPRKRLTAAQALSHPWVRGSHNVPLDIFTFKLVKLYLESSSLRRSALKALAKTLNEEDFYYLGAQFMLLKPDKEGGITLENFQMALLKSATEAMKQSHAWKILRSMSAIALNKMYFHEFCAAALNAHQLEMSENWEFKVRRAYEYFDKKGNRLVSVEELAEEMRIPETVPASTFLKEWVRLEDGKLSFTGFTKLLLA